jgi:predicted membrane metal-binding protein
MQSFQFDFYLVVYCFYRIRKFCCTFMFNAEYLFYLRFASKETRSAAFTFLSAFIILIFDTQQLFDVGFQLSFCAVLGIYWLNQPILNYFPKQDNWFKKLILIQFRFLFLLSWQRFLWFCTIFISFHLFQLLPTFSLFLFLKQSLFFHF